MGDLGSIPGLGRSPGEGKGYPLQYSGLENSVDSTVHGVAKSRTQLSNFHIHFSLSVVSNSLIPHGLQHARLPCPSPTSEACPNSCLWSWLWHPTMSFSVVPFSSFLYFPASGSFQMSHFFTSGGQSIGVSALTSVPQ